MSGRPTMAGKTPDDLQLFVPGHQRRGKPRTCLHTPVGRGRSRALRALPILDNPVPAIARRLEPPWPEKRRSFPTPPRPCRLAPAICRSCCKESSPATVPRTYSHGRSSRGTKDTEHRPPKAGRHWQGVLNPDDSSSTPVNSRRTPLRCPGCHGKSFHRDGPCHRIHFLEFRLLSAG